MSRRWASRAAFLVAAAALATGCGSIEAPSPDIPVPAPTSIAPSMGSTVGGQLIAIQGVGFTEGSAVLFDGVPATNVKVMSAAVITCVTPPHGEGTVTVRVFDRLGRPADLVAAYTYQRSFNQEGRPRLVNAVSTGNTGVRVIFSEPVSDGAENVSNFSIMHANVNSESGSLLVHSATLSADGISVDLVTSSQNEVIYELAAANIRDLDGNLLAPPELLVNPSVVDFAGTPPVAGSTLVDTDGDGLFDNVEQGGWTVTVWLTNGDIDQSTHTSDPNVADTDGDGVGDADELLAGSNPRDTDTDGDGVVDAEEWNDWWSDPTKQDTDEDGFADSFDLYFGLSPILDDTDGDGFDDYEELFELNRDPLIADLPRPQIVVTSYDLTLEVTSSYTDETGTSHSVESASTVSVSQSQATSLSRSDTRSTEASNRFSQSFGAEVGFSTEDGFSGKVSANVGFEQTRAQGYSSTVDTQTARESQQSFDESVGEALTTSENRSITRSIDGASIVATVNVANGSNVPFTVEDIEISVMRQDRAQGGAFRPVATLRPSEDLSLNLGPFDSERGPIIFENTDIFPNLVEELMREPNGLVFKIANFNVTDEEGRNFAYSSATVNSRTAGVTIDYGDGRTRTYRVATHNRFDAAGRAPGISMERALELIGFTLEQNDPELPDPLPISIPAAIRNSVGTRVDTSGIERLVRVGDVQNDFDPTNAEKRFWAIQTNNDLLDADVDFSSITLQAGQEYLLLYVRDVDEDELFDREEAMYGSSDHLDDTDGDDLDDYFEVRTGWTVYPTPGVPYLVFPSPARPDSDLDGLTDLEERDLGTDPNRADTDMDGLRDGLEYDGDIDIVLFDGDADDSNNEILELFQYDDYDPGTDSYVEAISPGPDGVCDTAAKVGSDDVELVTPGTTVTLSERCVLAGDDGVMETEPSGDDYVRAIHRGLFVLDPTKQDTDFDGIPDGREVVLGTNPNARDEGSVTDSDADGLFDAEEENGWDVYVNGAFVAHVTSNPNAPDTDLDGVPDVFEFGLLSNPRSGDTDGDLLFDGVEFDPEDVDNYYDPVRLVSAAARCELALNCTAPPVVALANRLRTDLRDTDTDNDTRSDYTEHQVPWTVTLHGAGGSSTATSVYSLPYRADADLDGLNDATELAEGTNPNLADTDADDTLDGVELAVTYGGIHRDPTTPDRLVTVSLPSSVTVVQSCDGLEDVTVDDPDFEGTLSLTYPNGSGATAYNLDSCDHKLDGVACDATPQTFTFFIAVGQSFSYTSSGFLEYDITDSEDVDDIQTQTYTYSALASEDTINQTHSQSAPGKAAWCTINVNVSIQIQ